MRWVSQWCRAPIEPPRGAGSMLLSCHIPLYDPRLSSGAAGVAETGPPMKEMAGWRSRIHLDTGSRAWDPTFCKNFNFNFTILFSNVLLFRDRRMSVPVYLLLMIISASTTTASIVLNYSSDSRSPSDVKLAEQLFFNNQSEPRIAFFSPAVFFCQI